MGNTTRSLGMADYDEQLKQLYGKYQQAIGKLIKLLEIRIVRAPVL